MWGQNINTGVVTGLAGEDLEELDQAEDYGHGEQEGEGDYYDDQVS